MIEAARMEMLLETYIMGKVFVESNQCLTFFAPVLSESLQSAKFVHLIRHPGDFVVSAARKGWHKNDSIWEAGRVKSADEQCWGKMDQIERLGWLWDFTNRFIRDFLATLPSARSMTCRFEDLVVGQQNVRELFSFCGGGIPDWGKVREIQARPVNRLWVDADEPANMKKNPGFPAYRDWSVNERRKLQQSCEDLAGDFGYQL